MVMYTTDNHRVTNKINNIIVVVLGVMIAKSIITILKIY